MTKSASQLLYELNETMLKWKIRSDNAKRGYEPKCKICNSKFQDETDKLYDSWHTFTDIKNYLEEKGENISIMSVSRHYNKHYPKRKAYLDNIKKMEDEAIQKAIEDYPRLKEIFQETTYSFNYDKPIFNDEGDCISFKSYQRPKIDIFLKDYGFCLTDKHLCSNVPKQKALYMEEVLSSIDKEIDKLKDYSYNDKKRVDMLNQKFQCFECRDLENTTILEYLIHAFTKNIIGVSLSPQQFKELFNENADYDFDEMDKIIDKLKVLNETPGNK